MDRARTFSHRTAMGLVNLSVDCGVDWIEVKSVTGPPRHIRIEGILDPNLIDDTIRMATRIALIDAHETKGYDPVPNIR